MAILFSLSKTVAVYAEEVTFTAIRAQGPGGQNVNKSATAVVLQYDTQYSSLPESTKTSILAYKDYRIAASGLITIKAQRYRSQEQNKQDAIMRLETLLQKALQKKKARKPSKTPKKAIEARLTNKKRQSAVKKLRNKPSLDE